MQSCDILGGAIRRLWKNAFNAVLSATTISSFTSAVAPALTVVAIAPGCSPGRAAAGPGDTHRRPRCPVPRTAA